MKLSRFSPIALALGIALSGAAHADVVKIGVAGPMTGALTQYGDMVKAGVLTAIEQINAKGGVNGHTFEAVMYDDACEPKQATAVANNIVKDGVKFVIGHVCSGATIPAAAIYDAEGIVMITPSATSPSLTQDKSFHYIFRTIGRDDQQGPVAAKFIIDTIKPQRVAVLHDKQSYGQGIATSVKQTLDAAKVPVVLFEGITAGESDYSAIITKLKAQNVDFVYFGGYHPEMGLLLRQARAQGLTTRFMGPEGVGNADIAPIAGPEAVEGMLVTLPADFTKDPANADVVAAFKAKSRAADGAFQMPAYSAVKIIADAISQTKSTDAEKVADAIHQGSFSTPIGNVAFNEKGDLKAFNFVVFNWHKDGSKSEAK